MLVGMPGESDSRHPTLPPEGGGKQRGQAATRPPWAIHLQPGSQIPREDEAARQYLRRGNLPEALLAAGSGAALVAGNRTLSHDELKHAATAAARRLEEAGVKPSAHVAIFAESSLEWIVAYLGLQLLGA